MQRNHHDHRFPQSHCYSIFGNISTFKPFTALTRSEQDVSRLRSGGFSPFGAVVSWRLCRAENELFKKQQCRCRRIGFLRGFLECWEVTWNEDVVIPDNRQWCILFFDFCCWRYLHLQVLWATMNIKCILQGGLEENSPMALQNTTVNLRGLVATKWN